MSTSVLLLNLGNDINLHKIVDIPSRKDRILDVILINKASKRNFAR